MGGGGGGGVAWVAWDANFNISTKCSSGMVTIFKLGPAWRSPPGPLVSGNVIPTVEGIACECVVMLGLKNEVFGGGGMGENIDPTASVPAALLIGDVPEPNIPPEGKESLDLTLCNVLSKIALLPWISKPSIVVAPSEGVMVVSPSEGEMVVTIPSTSMLLLSVPAPNSDGISLEAMLSPPSM